MKAYRITDDSTINLKDMPFIVAAGSEVLVDTEAIPQKGDIVATHANGHIWLKTFGLSECDDWHSFGVAKRISVNLQ